jgi:TctA family transporter
VLAAGAGTRIAGWSIRGPGRLEEASRAACEMAGVDRAEVTLGPDAAQLVGASPGFTSALAVVVAAQLVRTGQARNVLVAQRGGAAADCALVVTGGG